MHIIQVNDKEVWCQTCGFTKRTNNGEESKRLGTNHAKLNAPSVVKDIRIGGRNANEETTTHGSDL